MRSFTLPLQQYNTQVYNHCSHYFKTQKSSHSRNCESLIINYSIGSDIHIYTNVTPIVEFTLLGFSSEVHLRIALKQRKIADFDIVVNYLFSLIAACGADNTAERFCL